MHDRARHLRPHVASMPIDIVVGELRHRFANELAATLASLQLVRARRGDAEMVEEAISRVEAQARLLRLLSDPLPVRCDLVGRIGELAHLLIRSRRSGPGTTIRMSAMQVVMEGEQVERILVILNELLVNALKRVGDGDIVVTLRRSDDTLRIVVSNDAPDQQSSTRRSGGVRTMSRYARMHGGRLAVRVGNGTFRAILTWPSARRHPIDL